MKRAIIAALLLGCHTPPRMVPSEDSRIARIEDGLLPAVVIKGRAGTGRSIGERMERLGVSGAGVAVIDHERLIWTRTYGGGRAPEDEARRLIEAARVHDGRSANAEAMTGLEVSGAGRELTLAKRGDGVAMVIYPESGQGAVIVTEGGEGRELADEWLQAVAREYAWPGEHDPVEREVAAVDPATYDALAGRYLVPPSVALVVRRDGDRLFIDLPDGAAAELYPSGGDAFFVLDADTTVRFDRDATGKVTGLRAIIRGREIAATRN